MWGLLAGLRMEGPFWGLAAAPVLLAGCAVGLLVLAYLALPARWLSGLPVEGVFLACLLVAPAVLMGGLTVDALARAPAGWVEFQFRSGEAPRMDQRWRHMLPNRPGRVPGPAGDEP